MTSNDVREKINAALKEEQTSHRLRDTLARFVPAQELDAKLGFVYAYLLMTPIGPACSQRPISIRSQESPTRRAEGER